MAWKKRTRVAVIVAILVVVLGVVFAYFRFASQEILVESASRMEDVYTQVNSAFRSTISKNWRLLKSWQSYISQTAAERPEELQAFFQMEQEDWHYSEFYFLAEDGSYITSQGGSGRLELGEKLDQLMAGENLVTDGKLAGEEHIAFFAIPMEPGLYQGFAYRAIGVSFRSKDMTKALRIAAFSGKSECFVTDSTGHVIFSSREGETQPQNLLEDLRAYGSFSGSEVDEIAQDWRDGAARVAMFSLNGESCYLCYQPVGFSDWMMVSSAPRSAVTGDWNRFTLATLAVMGLLFGLAAVSVVFSLVRSNRRRLGEKNRELRSRDELFDLLTVNTDDIFILFSPKLYTADYVSPNLERVLGLKVDEVYQDVRPLLFGDMDQMFFDAQSSLTPETLSTVPMGGVWTGERDILHARTNELRWFKQLLHHCSLVGEDLFILMLSDRTKERQMNERLGEALHTAKAANEAKSNFLANMSHDIRTPMNAIVGFSVLLNRDAGDTEKVREYTRKIASSSQHLLSLINDVLDMSKIESGKTSLNIAEFNLPTLMDELYTMVLPQSRAKNQRFTLHTKGDLPEVLMGDKLRLSQVLINLLSNAVKYTQADGEISLTVCGLESNTSSRAHLRFIVADNGFGMSEGFVQTIFDPFTREITDSPREIQGTGLGMAITKNIVDLMGGTITVQSELDQGSIFTVDVELTVASPVDNRRFWTRRGITRMLAVDDDEDVCREIQESMKGAGVTVSYAIGGSAAVELVASAQEKGEAFQVILLDWKMPGMDGLETARQIRQQVGPEVPILVLTAYDLEDAKEAGMQAGIDMYLSKPFFRASLERVVAQVLDGNDEAAAGAPAEQKEITLTGLRVLAAEDNEINAEILVELLEIEGIQCEVVPNGKAVVDRFTQAIPGEFDIIFMDVQMPVMNGYEATQAIRASGHPEARTIPIIAMTANAFEEDIQTALAAGMNAHTAKPIDMEKLKVTAARLLKL